MTRPSWHILTAVPQTLEVRLELAKAIRTLLASDDNRNRLQRRVETRVAYQDPEALARSIPQAARECASAVSAFMTLRKYSPDQPRMPAGNRDGGQWTSEGTGDLPSNRYAALDAGTRTDATESQRSGRCGSWAAWLSS